MRSFAFIFVSQHGELEIKAAILAASLRKYLACKYELIVALPNGVEPTNAAAEHFRQMGARFATTGNSVDPKYLHANKIDCLRVVTTMDKLVFLDSDMLLMRKFDDEPRFAIGFNARPASNPSFSKNTEDFERIFRICGIPMPKLRVRATYGGDYMPPYFNSAFVAVPAKSGFGDAWLECARRIDRDPKVPNKRPYLDQISLAVAATKVGLEMDALDERYNHPINFKPLDELNLPYFCHYHDYPMLAREPATMEEVRKLAREFPTLRDVLNSPKPWAHLAESPRKIFLPTPELIITGIPRSGTSLLCNLLHRFDNCVAVNEPPEAPGALLAETMPWGLARYFRDIRRDILDGKPIRNKLAEGEVTQDTSRGGEFAMYQPRVASSDFVLGVKTTLAFLSRLREIRSVMPNARIVCCVRDPFDTIASWKSTFAHLRDAAVPSVNIGNPEDPAFSATRRSELIAVAAVDDIPSRRAAWWAYMARIVFEHCHDLILVRYQNMVSDPQATLNRILNGWPAGKAIAPIEPMPARRRTETLDADDLAAIRSLCAESAGRLGL